MKYEDVIEWIPFNSLVNVQKNGDGFLATWLNEMRYVNYEYIQSRLPSWKVEIKILTRTRNNLKVSLYTYGTRILC
jgi:hypothetical protein